MTLPPEQPQQFKSVRSNRFVVPGWTNLVPGKPDSVEVQIDIDPRDRERPQAVLLIEYWANNEELTLQSLLPARAFVAAAEEGWCVFVPAQGRLLVRAIDAQPDPPILASHWINMDPQTVPGTVVNVAVKFPDPVTPAQNLLLNNNN